MEGSSACVLGAGVVGLTTALLAQERGAKVTILADKFRKETTSDGAAGIFRPSPSFFIISPEITKELIHYSYHYYKKLSVEIDAGVKPVSGYFLSKINPSHVRNHLLEDVVPEYRSMTEDEMNQFPGGWKWGSYYSTLLIECRFFLPWAEKRFNERGGIIIEASISSFNDVKMYGNFDVVFNCTGYGAKFLCNDHKMVPLSGQIYKVDAPWCDKFIYGEEDTYIIPGYLLTVGGSRHFESFRTKPCPNDGAAIWSRAKALLPQLSPMQIRRQWVGVRPYRDGGVRVQTEIINGIKVVHNYGHGGYGVTSAPGTAFHALQLAEQLLAPSKF
ncbi:D-aspartate oxidase [Nesidiocoris tenuis]|uniref:D-aspartate oxidase n=1 Tax=Nesidiocoris tenuis TaxID=355587 RepID=A0ABN7BEV7_9HEMI|nr:D-aspartate oxidase [Nesidiocoris tenuis]